MANKMRTAHVSQPIGEKLTKNSGTGVKGENQSPAFSAYKQSMGPDTIPTKFAETGIGSAMRQTNQMRTANSNPRGTAKEATTSTVKKGPNKIRSARSTGPMGKI